MIYILCPPYLKTGGTELAHQFVYELKKRRDDVSIAYTEAEDGKYINPAFEKYVSEYVLESEIEDVESNSLILPETYTRRLFKYKRISMYIWWMSVDNYIAPKPLPMVYKQTGALECVKELYRRVAYPERKNCPLNKMDNVKAHLIQSEYAKEYLHQHGIDNIIPLSDYINDEYFNYSDNVDESKKENIVLYNPAKGKKFTQKLIKYCPEIKFIPLRGLTNNQVIDYMTKAKIYIDFGNHPGKDRLPRESATMKCCIITSKYGSAANNVDVSIPDSLKFDCANKDLQEIKSLIENIFADYDKYNQLYEEYRNKIKNEKSVFIDQVENLATVL